jgi:hypothetical protein
LFPTVFPTFFPVFALRGVCCLAAKKYFCGRGNRGLKKKTSELARQRIRSAFACQSKNPLPHFGGNPHARLAQFPDRGFNGISQPLRLGFQQNPQHSPDLQKPAA